MQPLSYPLVAARPDWQLLHGITGSVAYGTDLPGSDRDTRGVFVAPRAYFYGLDCPAQLADERQDHVFYELSRFVDLLARNNPNLLELLALPDDCILHRHPLFERFRPEMFLSKLCRDTFAGYAQTQIRKARGLNKKILNPLPKERKDILDFCYVLHQGGSRSLRSWLADHGYTQERCGLAAIGHFRDVYALYYDPEARLGFRGVIHKPAANEVALSSIPKGMTPAAYLSFNKDGYQTYCKDYREYWAWVEARNEERYADTLAHGKRYDAKNMLHTFRLLDMAVEIAREGVVRVRRPNRDELLAIRRGEFDYDELVARAETRLAEIDELYARSSLPERPDRDHINRLLVEVREEWYGEARFVSDRTR